MSGGSLQLPAVLPPTGASPRARAWPPGVDFLKAVDAYFSYCSLELNAEQMSVVRLRGLGRASAAVVVGALGLAEVVAVGSGRPGGAPREMLSTPWLRPLPSAAIRLPGRAIYRSDLQGDLQAPYRTQTKQTARA